MIPENERRAALALIELGRGALDKLREQIERGGDVRNIQDRLEPDVQRLVGIVPTHIGGPPNSLFLRISRIGEVGFGPYTPKSMPNDDRTIEHHPV